MRLTFCGYIFFDAENAIFWVVTSWSKDRDMKNTILTPFSFASLWDYTKDTFTYGKKLCKCWSGGSREWDYLRMKDLKALYKQLTIIWQNRVYVKIFTEQEKKQWR